VADGVVSTGAARACLDALRSLAAVPALDASHRRRGGHVAPPTRPGLINPVVPRFLAAGAA